jgi:hypothetical protein
MRTGIRLAGARGPAATTTVLGVAELRAGLLPATGRVSVLEDFLDVAAAADAVAAGAPASGRLPRVRSC